MKDLNPLEPFTTLRQVRNPSAPSSEEVWQQLRQHRAEIPARLEAQQTRSTLALQEPLAQVEQHEPSSRDTEAHIPTTRDEVGLIQAVAVKVSCLFSDHIIREI